VTHKERLLCVVAALVVSASWLALKVWHQDARLRDAFPVRTLAGHRRGVKAIVFSPAGDTLFTGAGLFSGPGEVKLWDPAQGQERATLSDIPGAVYGLAISPDGRFLAVGTSTGFLKVRDLPTGREYAPPAQGARTGLGVDVLAFVARGKTVRWVSWDGEVRSWEVGTEEVRSIARGRFGAKALSVDGQSLASAGYREGNVSLLDLATGREEQHTTHLEPVFLLCMAFSPDGRFLAAGTHEGDIVLWSREPFRLLFRLQGHEGPAHAVAFSSDGKWLASGGQDGTVKVWQVATGREKATLQGHRQAVRALAFAPRDLLLASGSSDRTVKLWDLATLQGN
jgi:WD40 repeat protein